MINLNSIKKIIGDEENLQLIFLLTGENDAPAIKRYSTLEEYQKGYASLQKGYNYSTKIFESYTL